MAQSVYPSSPSSSPKNASAQIFGTYQSTGTYTYTGTLAPGKYVVTADAINDGIGSTSTFSYSYSGTGVSGTVSNIGTPVYFNVTTPSTFSISGGTIPTSYPYTSAVTKPASNLGMGIASISPQYYSSTTASYPVNQLVLNGTGHILLKNGTLVSFSNNSGTSINLNWSTSVSNYYNQFTMNSAILGVQPYGASSFQFTTSNSFAAYGNGLIAAWSYYGANLYVSADGGVSWTARTMPQTPLAGSGAATISYLNNLWVATINTAATTIYIYTSTDTITWTQRFTGTAPYANVTVYGSKYVIGLNAAAGASNIIVSTDAVTWTLGSIPLTGFIQGIAWNGTKYVATGQQNTTANVNWASVSTDAITWTTGNISSAYAPVNSNISWNGSAFITEALNGAVYTLWRSTDAVTWTSSTPPVTGYSFKTTVVGTYFYGTIMNTNTGPASLYSSTDGITWTTSLTLYGFFPNANGYYKNFNHIFSAGSYVYALSSYTGFAWESAPGYGESVGARIYVNGATTGSVTTVTTPILSPTYNFFVDSYYVSGPYNFAQMNISLNPTSTNTGIFYQANTNVTNWMVYGSYGIPSTNIFLSDSSTDISGYRMFYATPTFFVNQYFGTASSSVYTYSTTGTWYAAAWVNNLFLVGGASGALQTSPGAVRADIASTGWTARTSGFVTNAIRAIAYGNGIYLIGGDNGSLSTSTDGVTWTARTSGFGTTTIRTITGRPQNNGQWLFAAGGDSGTLTTSTDGITWTLRSLGITSSINVSLPFTQSPSYPLILGTSNSLLLYPSASDGSAWNRLNVTNFPNTINSDSYISYTTSTGNAMMFPQAVIPGSTNPAIVDNMWLNINTVAYGNNLYLAAGANGQMYTSTDTITWTSRSIGTIEHITAVSYLNTIYVAGTIDGNIYTSTDGTTWTARTSNIQPGYQINNLTYLNGKYYAAFSSHVAKNLRDLGSVYSPLYTAFSNFKSSDFVTGGVQTSTDGITWTATSTNTNFAMTGVNGIAYNGLNFLTANGGGPNLVHYATGTYPYGPTTSNGSSLFLTPNFTTYLSNSIFNLMGYPNGVVDVAYNNGYHCVITTTSATTTGSYNVILSTDLVTWTTYNIPMSSNFISTWYSVNYGQVRADVAANSVTPGPGNTFIITTTSKYPYNSTSQAYLLNPTAGTITPISLPLDTGQLALYKQNVAYNPTNGRILFATRSGILASGTISTTATNTYYPSIFSLYSVNA